MKKTTVFLIDDDADDQEIFEIAMQRHDADVDCVFADNGPEALEMLTNKEDFVPDYIFLDINMPMMTGDECLAELRKIDRLKNVPVYMYSTSAYSHKEDTLKEMGVADYIVKPSTVSDLTNVLSGIVRRSTFSMLVCMCLLSFFPDIAKGQDTLPAVKELKKLPIEELMNIMVTSVSRHPERLTETASAIQVLTNQDIRRSNVSRLPEALRLAPNLQVAQGGSSEWGITARGFNGAPISGGSLANKLLVLIDGRSVYTPLFGGVFWDVQNVLLEDLDRIEVVSGPGGVLWGANAVNGVINVLSKSAKETQGVFVTGSAGNFLNNRGALRYGGKIGENTFYRAYGMRHQYNSTKFISGESARDEWHMTKGGFRMDFTGSEKNKYTLQGDIYAGNASDTNITDLNGLNFIGRWKHSFNSTSDFTLQTYIDQSYRKLGTSGFRENLLTYDVDVDYGMKVGSRHNILVGAAYRMMYTDTESPGNTFTPEDRTLDLLSAFLHDEIEVVKDFLEVTVGIKMMHDTYSRFNYHPSARFSWMPDGQQTLWGAASQAVRVPSRFDVDISIFQAVDYPEYKPEKVVSWELGYKWHPMQTYHIAVTGFYNQYTDLRTLTIPENSSLPFVFGNDMDAETWGIELSGRVILLTWWRIRGGYTYLQKDFTITSMNVIPGTEFVEAIDPNHQVLLHSIMDLPKGFQLDLTGRFIDVLPAAPLSSLPSTPSYYNLGARLAWAYRFVTFSASGQNLLAKSHREFGLKNISRHYFGRVTLRF